jgi:4-methylaminobutanoate oxidase (formaldehyde-forming)
VTAGEYQADVGGRRVPITVSLRPMYDPDGKKIKP